MEKNGHWYTDKNGKHYFVENGQSPKEGWEASNRRKMLKNGKYNVSEDGVNYKEVGEDEYRKFEADEDFDIDDVDSVRDFDEEEVTDKGLSQKELDTQKHNAKIDKINKLYEQDKISKKEYHKMIDEEVDAFNELQKNWPIEEYLEGEEAVTDEDISQTLEDVSWMTDDTEELAEIVAKQMKIDKDRVMSVINKEKGEGTEEDDLEKGEITDKERESLNSDRQKNLLGEDDKDNEKKINFNTDEYGLFSNEQIDAFENSKFLEKNNVKDVDELSNKEFNDLAKKAQKEFGIENFEVAQELLVAPKMRKEKTLLLNNNKNDIRIRKENIQHQNFTKEVSKFIDSDGSDQDLDEMFDNLKKLGLNEREIINKLATMFKGTIK